MPPVLHILGYCEEMIPILAEIALDRGYAPLFRIVENMELEKGRYRIDVPGVRYEWIWKTDWSPTGEETVAFSVVQPSSKRKVFQEFQAYGGLQRENYPDLAHPSASGTKYLISFAAYFPARRRCSSVT